MTEVEILADESTLCGDLGVHPGIPLAALDQHRCVRDQRVAADVIEMEMRVDDEVDLAGISVNRFEPGADLLARLKADTKQPGEPRAEPSSGDGLAIRVQPCVDLCLSFWVLIRKTGSGTV